MGDIQSVSKVGRPKLYKNGAERAAAFRERRRVEAAALVARRMDEVRHERALFVEARGNTARIIRQFVKSHSSEQVGLTLKAEFANDQDTQKIFAYMVDIANQLERRF